MNTLIVISALLAFSALASADVSGRFYGCASATKGVADHDFNIYAKQYPYSKHVFYFLQVTVRRPTTSFSLDICFDAPQCITAAWNVHLYPVQLGNGAHCWSLVSNREMNLKDGDTIAIRFEAWSSSPVQISSVTLQGNGVIETARIPRYSPGSPQAYCTACDGDYFADSQSCNHFYQCSNGTPFKMPCPSGLYFNSAKDVCDYPQNAGCYMSQTPGKRRIQCRGADGNCPANTNIYQTTRLIDSCTHGNPSPPP